MNELHSDIVLKKLRRFIKKTQLVEELGESIGNYNRSIELIKNLDALYSLTDKIQFVSSRRSGISAKLNNKIINKVYWIIKNTLNPVIDTQQRFNKTLIELFRSSTESFKKLTRDQKLVKKRVSSIEKSLEKPNLYELLDYHGFEDENRGAEEGLLDIQSPYVEYFNNKKNVLDIGCGRGEFLSLLENRGITCKGIELSSEFVEYCQSKGLNVEAAEALTYLAAQPDNSIGGMIALQVVEHLDPAYLIKMIQLAYQKMSRSGYIILETLNPQSLIVFSASYYKDLTHIQPIHPATLLFLCKSAGFEGCEVKYSAEIDSKDLLKNLPETPENEIENTNIDKLNNLLFGPQNYAIIGKKI